MSDSPSHDNPRSASYNVPMLQWLTRKRRMTGGLVFGPPAWYPDRIEDTFDNAAPSTQVPLFAQTENQKSGMKGGAGGVRGAGGGKTENHAAPADRPALVALLDKIRLTRASNATPALVEQLRDLADRPLQALVLNLLPTQPEFTLGSALTRLALPDLLAAVALLQQTLVPKRTLVILDRHDFKARRLWRAAARRHRLIPGNLALRRRSLLNRYPQAHPTILLRSLTGRRLAVGALPTSLRMVVIDPVSAWVLGRHLRTGQAFAERPVQFFAPNMRPRLLMARIGETVAAFCSRYGASTENCQVILDGMLTGRIVDPHNSVLSSSTESIALREPPLTEVPTPCITCGWCVDVCPTALTPIHLLQLAQKTAAPPPSLDLSGGRPASPVTLAILRSKAAHESRHCISCGLCSYVCPSRLPLMDETLTLHSRIAALGTQSAGSANSP